MRLAYGDCLAPPGRWVEAEGSQGRYSAALAAPPAASPPARSCLWTELEPLDGPAEARRWPLPAPP